MGRVFREVRRAWREQDKQESISILMDALFLNYDSWKRHHEKYRRIRLLVSDSFKFCEEINPRLVEKRIHRNFILLPSKEIGYVTYYQSLKKLFHPTEDGEGIRTKTTLGRFLKRHTDFSDSDIKEMSEKFAFISGAAKFYFIQNDNPEGWEAVYENGYGFSSCMVYGREDRYLNYECHGENHPVRSYAHPDNDLALAYIANREWDGANENFKVYGRAIVNMKRKQYVSSYGNSLIETLLKSSGFEHDSTCLCGQKLVLRRTDDVNIIAPYLDGAYRYVKEVGDCLVIDNNGYETTSNGLIESKWECPYCGCVHDDENDAAIFIDEYSLTLCINCVPQDFELAWVDRYSQEYVRKEDAYAIEGDFYTAEAAEAWGFVYIESYDKWVPEREAVETSRGIMWMYDREVVRLSVEDPSGYKYAHIEDTIEITINGETAILYRGTQVVESDQGL